MLSVIFTPTSEFMLLLSQADNTTRPGHLEQIVFLPKKYFSAQCCSYLLSKDVFE